MISMDIAGLILIIGLTVFVTCVVKDPASWIDDWDWFKQQDVLGDIKHWFHAAYLEFKEVIK